MPSSLSSLRRARPLLGTFVDIQVSGEARRLTSALEAAFQALVSVQDKMSFHEPDSDVSRMNRDAFRRTLVIHPDTWDVLSAAGQITEASRGAFDVTMAPHLVRWGYLPRPSRRPPPRVGKSGFQSLSLLPGNRVRFLEDVWVDLGGIAKGYGVDRACSALESRGVFNYVVNAGGDLRVGRAAVEVWVRHPTLPGKFVHLPPLRCASLATSAATFSRKMWRGTWVHPLVSPRTGQPVPRGGSLTVRAKSCMVADALTKVASVLGGQAESILKRFSARALWISDE